MTNDQNEVLSFGQANTLAIEAAGACLPSVTILIATLDEVRQNLRLNTRGRGWMYYFHEVGKPRINEQGIEK